MNPTNKPVRIRTEDLKQLITLADKATGTLEPLWRYVVLIPSSPVQARITDGCLQVELPLPWLTVPFGRRPTALPIDPIKGFLKPAEGELELLVGSQWRLKFGTDVLILKPKVLSSVPPWPKTEPLGTVPLKRLLVLLDFPSAHLTDADYLEFILTGRRLLAVGISGGILALAEAPLEKSAETSILVPYASARHAVKALQTLKPNPITLVLAPGGFLGAAAQTGKIGLFGREQVPNVDKIAQAFSPASRSVWYISRTGFKALLERAARMERSGASKAVVRLYTNRIEVVTEQTHAVFTTSEPISMAKNPTRLEFPVRAEAMLRLATRMSAEKLQLRPATAGVLLSDGASRHVLIEPRYIPKGSSEPAGPVRGA